MEKKITYVEAINSAIEGNMTDEVVSRLHDLIKSLSAKSASKKQTEAQERAKAGKELIMAALIPGKEYRVMEIHDAVPELAQFERGQIIRMVTSLRSDDHLLERVTHKGLVYYFIPEENAEQAIEVEEVDEE